MDVPWKVILAFVGVFIAGAVFGGVFTIGVSARRFAHTPKQPLPAEGPIQQLPAVKPPKTEVAGPLAPKGGREMGAVRGNPITLALMRELTRKLSGLTDAQKESLRKTVGRAGEDLHRLRINNFEDVGRVTERMYADVSAVLTIEQRGELEKMRRETEERMQKKRNQPPPVEAGSRPGQSAPAVVPLPPSRKDAP
jgi:hypothetical protein